MDNLRNAVELYQEQADKEQTDKEQEKENEKNNK